ncbi:MAG: FeoB small GTPase domain-containing protein [Candidatus Methanosuratincola petrocarbonis]
MIRAALIGNPNVGKTEIFNRLTRRSQRVGNFPGVTVEKTSGRLMHKGKEIEVMDLPGIYSLTASSVDEIVARDYIIEERPDVIVDVVDGINLERNLYLTLLLLEMDANLVIALNRWDMVNSRGLKINVERLSKIIGCPVVPTVAVTGDGLEDLKDSIVDVAEQKKTNDRSVVQNYGDDIEHLIKKVESVIKESPRVAERYSARWLAIKLLEGDENILEMMKASMSYSHISKILDIIDAGEVQ